MAINIGDEFPGRSNVPGTGTPFGSARNRTSPTSQDGTYLREDLINDVFGFLYAMLVNAGDAPNGTVDNTEDSQYYDALQTVVNNLLDGRVASETVQGVIELATTLEAQGLADDLRALTSVKMHNAYKGANQSVGNSGWQLYPGGMIRQWGNIPTVATLVTVTYPITFPNSVLSATAMTNRSGALGGTISLDSNATFTTSQAAFRKELSDDAFIYEVWGN